MKKTGKNAIMRCLSAVAALTVAFCGTAAVSADNTDASANSVVETAEGELLGIVYEDVRDVLGIKEYVTGGGYLGRDLYAFQTDSGMFIYKITERDMENFRRTGKLNAVPVKVDSKLDGVSYVCNYGAFTLDTADYILFYLKDSSLWENGKQYFYVVKYNEKANTIDVVAEGDAHEIGGATEDGYVYSFTDEDNVFVINSKNLETGAWKKITMDYSNLGENYVPGYLTTSYITDGTLFVCQFDTSETAEKFNKGGFWKIDVTTGETEKLESKDTYAFNGNKEAVFYYTFDDKYKVYRCEDGKIFDVTDINIVTDDSGVNYYLTAIASYFYGTKVVAEFKAEDGSHYAYALVDLADNTLLTDIYPWKSRSSINIAKDGSVIFDEGDKWILVDENGKLRVRFDDISDVSDMQYALVTDNDRMFYLDSDNKRISEYCDFDGVFGSICLGSTELYRVELQDGTQYFMTWTEPYDVQAAQSDTNPGTGTADIAGLLAAMCASGAVLMIAKKRK